jgi:methionine sulfoxide reductase heme-binding subunit
MRDPFHYTTWLAARSAGIVGFATLGVVSLLGLAAALRLVTPATMVRLRPWHERLALTGLALIVAHGLFLALDPWLRPGVLGVLVPFTMKYRPLWTGAGILAFYALAALALSFYARRRVGARRWRAAHRLAPFAFLLGCLHALGAGTDARSPVLLGVIVGVVGAVAALAAARIVGISAARPAPRPARREPAAAPAAAAAAPSPPPVDRPAEPAPSLWAPAGRATDRRA